jgi:hypothetical protein
MLRPVRPHAAQQNAKPTLNSRIVFVEIEIFIAGQRKPIRFYQRRFCGAITVTVEEGILLITTELTASPLGSMHLLPGRRKTRDKLGKMPQHVPALITKNPMCDTIAGSATFFAIPAI